ncbi:hypothetical protein I5U05_003200 [Stenotrophomonas maltophilia]|jgi:hypothetical protein|uniref:hypothetical protein n=1 Tax=Stenotrophomonas maltophilia TaxID=40324 RepID=UPI000518303C|nr:hypothetical protein [Stenotrophomonas maltophilia]KWV54449.1 hypothetical protein AS591_05875 [Stenotrophomonas maltophilia]MBA0462052.1 hypothetical protein [Stenotrophomonas maltophilia]MBC8772758.1 hypothetical protein [Stenotrophomonas maltophilia]MBH1610024.1 hypothetical protein [Stenotrophomonas maltophilia]MBH1723884.1 hypothetical protein [Stenotrophomonas maltophilia]
MRDAVGLDIYLQLAGHERVPDRDDQLLARLAQLARQIAPDDQVDQFGSGDIENSLHAIVQSPALFPVAIARWLTNDGDIPLGKALLHKANVSHLAQRFPQSYDLARVPESDAITTARRLCALAATPAISLGWVLSMAREFSGSYEVRTQTSELLGYHIDQLLVSTVELLASPESSFQGLDASIEALRRAREARQTLDGLPQLRELDMTADMRLLYSSLKRSEHREIHRRAEEASVFHGLLHQVRLKYAIRPVIEVRSEAGTQEMVVPMSSHELSVELPLSEHTDPVLGRMRRNGLWGSSRT